MRTTRLGGLLLALALVHGCGQTIGDDDSGTDDDDLFDDDDLGDDDSVAGDDDSALDDDDLGDDDDAVDPCADHCGDALLNCGETAVDCGGDCAACQPVVLCEDGCTFPTVAATDELVIVVWGVESDSLRAHWVCDDGGGWTAPEAIPTATHSGEFARLDTDSFGNVHLIFHQGLGNNRAVMYARFDGGVGCAGSWTTPVQVDDGQDNSCWPQIAVDSAGDPHVTWTDRDYYEIHYARAESGVWAGPVAAVGTAEMSNHSDVTVSGDTVHLAWQEGESPRLPTWAYGTIDGFSAPVTLNDGFYNWPQLATDPAGDIHALYTQRNGDHEIRYRKASGASWGSEQTISTSPGGWAWSSLAADDAGGLHAVWHRTDGVEHVQYAVGDAASGSWQTSRRVSTEGGRNNQDTTLSVDPAGRAHIVWARKDSWEADLPGPVIYRVVTWADLE